MVQFLFRENRDYRFYVIEEDDGKEKEVDCCDRIAAESLALEAVESGIPVRWEYLEDVLSPKR